MVFGTAKARTRSSRWQYGLRDLLALCVALSIALAIYRFLHKDPFYIQLWAIVPLIICFLTMFVTRYVVLPWFVMGFVVLLSLFACLVLAEANLSPEDALTTIPVFGTASAALFAAVGAHRCGFKKAGIVALGALLLWALPLSIYLMPVVY